MAVKRETRCHRSCPGRQERPSSSQPRRPCADSGMAIQPHTKINKSLLMNTFRMIKCTAPESVDRRVLTHTYKHCKEDSDLSEKNTLTPST
eukprot:2515763-Amphidinium_carterae.1